MISCLRKPRILLSFSVLPLLVHPPLTAQVSIALTITRAFKPAMVCWSSHMIASRERCWASHSLPVGALVVPLPCKELGDAISELQQEPYMLLFLHIWLMPGRAPLQCFIQNLMQGLATLILGHALARFLPMEMLGAGEVSDMVALSGPKWFSDGVCNTSCPSEFFWGKEGGVGCGGVDNL